MIGDENELLQFVRANGLDRVEALERQTRAMLRGNIVRGEITSAGAVVRGSGFTASKAATGTYDVVFSKPFATVPIVVVTGTNWPGIVATATKLATGFRAVFFNTSTLAPTDSAFDFSAMVP